MCSGTTTFTGKLSIAIAFFLAVFTGVSLAISSQIWVLAVVLDIVAIGAFVLILVVSKRKTER